MKFRNNVKNLTPLLGGVAASALLSLAPPAHADDVHHVADIAALEALPNGFETTADLVYLDGYYTPGDGGQGFFKLTTTSASPDSCVNFVNTGGSLYFVRQFSQFNAEFCGLKKNSAIDDQAAVQAAIDYGHNNGPLCVHFNGGDIYLKSDNDLNLGANAFGCFVASTPTRFLREPVTTIDCVISFDAGGSGAYKDAVTFTGPFLLKGNADVSNGACLRGMVRGTFDLHVVDVAHHAIDVQFGVSDVIRAIVSSNVDGSFSQNPTHGVFITTDGTSASSDITLSQPLIEGAPSTAGIEVENGSGTTISGGTVEGLATGILIDAAGIETLISNIDMEANSVADLVENGRALTVTGASMASLGSSGSLVIGSGSQGNAILGGYTNTATLGSGSFTSFKGGQVSSLSSEGIEASGDYSRYITDGGVQRVDRSSGYAVQGFVDNVVAHPTLFGGTTPGTQTWSQNWLQWVRVGKNVDVRVYMINNTNSGGSGAATFGNLGDMPALDGTSANFPVGGVASRANGVGFSGSDDTVSVYYDTSGTLGLVQSQGSTSASALPITAINPSSELILSFSYPSK